MQSKSSTLHANRLDSTNSLLSKARKGSQTSQDIHSTTSSLFTPPSAYFTLIPYNNYQQDVSSLSYIHLEEDVCSSSSSSDLDSIAEGLSPIISSLINHLASFETKIYFCLDPLDSSPLSELFSNTKSKAGTSVDRSSTFNSVGQIKKDSEFPLGINQNINSISTFIQEGNCQNFIQFEGLIKNLHVDGQVSEEVLVIAFAYILRILKDHELKYSGFIKQMYSACVFLAYKYHEELSYWSYEEFSKMINCETKVLEKCESQLLKILDFKFHVSEADYNLLTSSLK